jgi:hypothetical protein
VLCSCLLIDEDLPDFADFSPDINDWEDEQNEQFTMYLKI